MKPIRLTRHARNRMRWREIDEAMIRETIETPDWEGSSASGRVNRWKRVSDRFLRVTLREEPERLTAVVKRQPPRGREAS